MPEFLFLATPSQAVQKFVKTLEEQNGDTLVQGEWVPTEQAAGRVTAGEINSPEPLPGFARATVDGYAVRAEDTFGASDSLPMYLRLVGEVLMGEAPEEAVDLGTCYLIHTGGMLPVNANAVVMLENTQLVRSLAASHPAEPDSANRDQAQFEVEVLHSVAVGENVIRAGEDVFAGEMVIPAGRRLRAVEIGGLMALGIEEVKVARKPKVAIISSGDEVVVPGAKLKPGQVRDVNSYSLSVLVEEVGGIAARFGIVPDDRAALSEIASRAIDDCDILVITAGSSASMRDYTAEVINQLGQPGVIVHGVNIRPGKPTILGVCAGKPVIGLPGNPISAYVAARSFVKPAVELYLGLDPSPLKAVVKAKLSVNLASQAGRQDWIAVRLFNKNIERTPAQGSERRIYSSAMATSDDAPDYIAEPVFGKSNLIFTLVRADGLLCIPSDATGINAGETVDVELF